MTDQTDRDQLSQWISMVVSDWLDEHRVSLVFALH